MVPNGDCELRRLLNSSHTYIMYIEANIKFNKKRIQQNIFNLPAFRCFNISTYSVLSCR